jgi:hypothetical protein
MAVLVGTTVYILVFSVVIYKWASGPKPIETQDLSRVSDVLLVAVMPPYEQVYGGIASDAYK